MFNFLHILKLRFLTVEKSVTETLSRRHDAYLWNSGQWKSGMEYNVQIKRWPEFPCFWVRYLHRILFCHFLAAVPNFNWFRCSRHEGKSLSYYNLWVCYPIGSRINYVLIISEKCRYHLGNARVFAFVENPRRRRTEWIYVQITTSLHHRIILGIIRVSLV